MIVSNIYKTLCRSRLLSGSLALSSTVLNGRLAGYEASKDTRIREKIVFAQSRRSYSDETQINSNTLLPPLCNFPPALWPKFLNTLRNFWLINMVIKSGFDSEFNENEFMTTTKKVVYIVSSALASENYERLEGLVVPEMIQTLRNKISTLSTKQKERLVVQEQDIYLSFPYDVAVTYNTEHNRQRRFVEITVVHHCMQGFGRMQQMGESLPMDMLNEYQDRICICNYRFLREYTEGVDSPWILNVVNHFSPMAAMLRKN